MTDTQTKLMATLYARYQRRAEQAAEDAKAVDRIAAGLPSGRGRMLSSLLDQSRRTDQRVAIMAQEVL